MSTCCVQSARLRPCAEALHSSRVRNCATTTTYSSSQNYAKISWDSIDRFLPWYSNRCGKQSIDPAICLLAYFNATALFASSCRGKKANLSPSPRQKPIPAKLCERKATWWIANVGGDRTYFELATRCTRANSATMTQRRLCGAQRRTSRLASRSSNLKWERFFERVCFM